MTHHFVLQLSRIRSQSAPICQLVPEALTSLVSHEPNDAKLAASLRMPESKSQQTAKSLILTKWSEGTSLTMQASWVGETHPLFTIIPSQASSKCLHGQQTNTLGHPCGIAWGMVNHFTEISCNPETNCDSNLVHGWITFDPLVLKLDLHTTQLVML